MSLLSQSWNALSLISMAEARLNQSLPPSLRSCPRSATGNTSVFHCVLESFIFVCIFDFPVQKIAYHPIASSWTLQAPTEVELVLLENRLERHEPVRVPSSPSVRSHKIRVTITLMTSPYAVRFENSTADGEMLTKKTFSSN